MINLLFKKCIVMLCMSAEKKSRKSTVMRNLDCLKGESFLILHTTALFNFVLQQAILSKYFQFWLMITPTKSTFRIQLFGHSARGSRHKFSHLNHQPLYILYGPLEDG